MQSWPGRALGVPDGQRRLAPIGCIIIIGGDSVPVPSPSPDPDPDPDPEPDPKDENSFLRKVTDKIGTAKTQNGVKVGVKPGQTCQDARASQGPIMAQKWPKNRTNFEVALGNWMGFFIGFSAVFSAAPKELSDT